MNTLVNTDSYITNLPASILKNDLDTTQGKIWQLLSTQYYDIQIVILQFLIIFSIDDQSGQILDLIGKLVGESRKGKNDNLYKLFLKIAIQKYLSRGDIYSINEIGIALGINPLNIVELGQVTRLDGLALLDGSRLLDGQELPARFSFERIKNVNDTTDDLTITTIIDSIRAAGITAEISFIFNINQGQCFDYTSYSNSLDGTVLLDGQTALNTKKDYTPNEIALGNGGEPGGTVREPQASDTGLQNEIVRREVVTTTNETGKRIHYIELGRQELGGNTINEAGIFLGTTPILMDAFPGKAKNDVTAFKFIFIETN